MLLSLADCSYVSTPSHSESGESVKAPAPFITIDNGIIGEPEVRCGSEDISLHFNTHKPFLGKIFVKGHVSESGCLSHGDSRPSQSFSIRFDSCGLRRQREINGVVIIATVIVSFHTIFITKVDRAYRTSCFYMETTKTVNHQIDVGQLTTAVLRGQVPLPTCRYEILSGGSTGTAVAFARIGDAVYHKWSCDAEVADVYCMRVHSCTVYDGQGGSPVTVIDEHGCAVDPAILRPLDYPNDLQAGQESQVFKFADRVGLYFNCQIQLTLKEKQYGCLAAQPECPSPYQQARVEPSTITSEPGEESGEDEESDTYAKTTTPPTSQDEYSTVAADSGQLISSTPISPSGYKSTPGPPPLPSAVARSRGREEYSGEAEVVRGDYATSAETRPPYELKVNPFEPTVPLDASSEYPFTTSPYTKEGAMPPGVKPSYDKLPSTEYPEEYHSSASAEEQQEKYAEAAPTAENSSRQQKYSTGQPEPYTRLIRRRARARSAGRTVERQNLSDPLFVADFDLPEKGLIVLGLEDGHDQQAFAQADRLFNEQSSSCEDNSMPSSYALFFSCLLFCSAALIAVLVYIIYRQRKLLKSPLL